MSLSGDSLWTMDSWANRLGALGCHKQGWGAQQQQLVETSLSRPVSIGFLKAANPEL